MPFATAADGTRIAYEMTGQGDPVLLISGQALDRTMWAGTAPLLARSFQVIRFDARGTGASDKPRTPYSTRIFAADAVAVLDAAGFARSHVYGFSMGGRVAQYIAIDHSDRVGALILGGTGPGGPHAIPKPPDIDAALIRGPRSVLAEGFYSPAYLIAHPDAFAPPVIPAHARALHFAASEGHNAWDELPCITAPTLVIHGTADRMSNPANGALLAERIPGARLALIEGARHGYVDEYRAEAIALVEDFLREHAL
jgi:3-oxoadipate enol-lactonase